MEQICAYVRHNAHGVGGDIRGIDRVRRNSQNRSVKIDTASEHQIMSNQRAYGLWGLFTVPARVSGLIEGAQDLLTQEARELIEKKYLPQFESVLPDLNTLLLKGGSLSIREPSSVFETLIPVLSEQFDEEEVTFYRSYLCEGRYAKPTPINSQTHLTQLVVDNWQLDQPLTQEKIVELSDKAKAIDEQLYHRLDQIVRADAVMLVISRIFDQILSRDRYSIADLARELKNAWGNAGIAFIEPSHNRDLIDEINQVYEDKEIARLFDQCQIGIYEGRYADVADLLLKWNQLIQSRRGGAPWVRIGNGGKFDVRYRSFEYPLPTVAELEVSLRFTYFFDALQNIASQLTRQSA